mgnify:FL=1
MKIALLSATEKDPRREALRAAALYLLQHGAAAVYVDAAAEKAFSTEPLQPCFLPAEELYGAGDVLLVLGGDGSIIRAARLCGGAAAILGINLGRVGFLAEAERQQTELLDALLRGEYTVQERIMLRAKIAHADGTPDTKTPCALNDIVVSNGTLSRMVEAELLCDGCTIQTYRADGIIVATPTGSTAYSMSAGGPILHPLMDCLCLTPVCSHSLWARPLVVGGQSIVQIRNLTREPGDAYLSVDGALSYPLRRGDTVTVQKADSIARMVHFAQNSFYDILHRKFHETELHSEER